MIFNTKRTAEVVIDGVTFTCHYPDALEQAQLLDSISANDVEGCGHIIPLAKVFFEIAIDKIDGLVDDLGNAVEYPKVDGKVPMDFVQGFSLGNLNAIVEAVIALSEARKDIKKK